MGSLKTHADTIESLIRERKETEEEIRRIQEEIDRLTELKKEKARKLTEICSVARTISAGD